MYRRLQSRILQFVHRTGSRYLAQVSEDDSSSPHFEKCYNQVNLLGRVGRDAEMRGTQDHPVVIFSLATSFHYMKSSGELTSRVDWHRISVFKPGLRDKVAVNVKKGDRVFISGSLQYSEFLDSSNLMQKTTTIIANDILNLTKRYLSGSEES